MNLGSSEIAAYYISSSQVDKIMLGSDEVYTRASSNPPSYDFSQALIESGGFKYVDDIANVPTDYNGKLLNDDDTAYNPSSAQYPEDGTIDLSGGKKINTGWEAPSDETWSIGGIYDVVMGVSYKIYVIDYKGDNTCDIYLGDHETEVTLSESGKSYTPPSGDWIFYELPPAIIDNIDPVITMLGSSPVDVEQYGTYNDAGATALDNRDGDITADIVTVNPVDEDVIDEYTVTYNVDDEAENSADEVTRTVNVVAAATYEPILISVGTEGSSSSNTWNSFILINAIDVETTLVDEEGTTVTGATILCTTQAENVYHDDSGNNGADACGEAFMMYGFWYVESGADETCVIALKLPTGTYDITFHSMDETTGTPAPSDFNFNGSDFTINSNQDATNCHTVEDVSYSGTAKNLTMTLNGSQTYAALNGITIQRTA